MCLHPIEVHRKIGSSLTVDVVPCGKCIECKNKKRLEAALLCCLEGEYHGFLSYFTLTYRNNMLPFALSEEIDGIRRIFAFSRGDGYSYFQQRDNGDLCAPSFAGDMASCPTVYNEDWKAHLHRFRSWCRRVGKPLDFSFLQFQEYGELKRRPHYHCVVFGFDADMDAMFESLWNKYFGLTHLDRINRFNSDGSDAFLKVSKYISKYISKGEFLPDFVMDGFALKPRRISSIGFGRKHLDIERLRSFT